MAATLSDRGRFVATASAVSHHAQSEWGYTECILGEKLTQADIEVEALRPARTLGDFVKENGYSGSVQLITGSTIDSLLTEHPQIPLTIQYAKRTPWASSELATFPWKRSRDH